MKELIFAPLSLRELGRAAPTCQDFRAAYTARLSAAHLAAVEAGFSCFGEAFLRELSIQILGHARRSHLMFRGGGDVGWCLSHRQQYNGYSESSDGPGYPQVRLSWWNDYYGRPERTCPEFPQIAGACPSFSVACVKQGRILRVTANCYSGHRRQVAGAVAAVCGYLEREVGGSTPARCGKPLKPALVFDIYERDPFKVGGRPSEGEIIGVVAALLPLSKVVDIERISWSLPYRPGLVAVASFTQFLAMCHRG
jgi:hypothetical protein